jgi:50S ribosomal protein L16 3-hydroxylase
MAVGNCMTFSLGMRAPSQAELLLDFAEFLAEPLGEGLRYVDPDLQPARDNGEISAQALGRVAHALERLRNIDASMLTDWFGRFITRYRSAQVVPPPRRALAPDEIAKRLRHARVIRNPWSRFAWHRNGRNAALFVAGERYPCPLGLARTLCARREFDGRELSDLCREKSAQEVIAALVNAGHLHIAPSR